MIICENPDFHALPGPLSALFSAAAELSFFGQAEWFGLVARHGCDPGLSVRLYADSAEPAAMLICRAAAGRLDGLSNFYTMEYAPIIAANEAGPLAAASALIGDIAREHPTWNRYRFDALDPTEPSYSALLNGMKSAGLVANAFFDCGVWFEDTTRMEFKQYLESRPSQLLNTWRRRERSSKAESVRYLYNDPDQDLESLIAAYDAVYANSWQKKEGYPEFMPALMRMAARLGALRLGVCYIRDTPAAAQFWLVWRGRAVIYKLAYDQRYAKLSLGTLLTMRMMERVL
ncbi:MAG: GNAT family N-acetyltransferase, partial [Stellaceae bacterium]